LSKGANALQAAEKVHTDFAKGFINAEVIRLKKLLGFENFLKAREAGKVRQEGREYKVQDEDVIEFKVRG
jgi:ribosome-binding ATPase YchF (GTP1/OBG family)